jgi:hypothetical protein
VSSVSNGLYFLTVQLVSVMRVIYTSKGMPKILGRALYIRCALSIKKYGIVSYKFALKIRSARAQLEVKKETAGTANRTVIEWTGRHQSKELIIQR